MQDSALHSAAQRRNAPQVVYVARIRAVAATIAVGAHVRRRGIADSAWVWWRAEAAAITAEAVRQVRVPPAACELLVHLRASTRVSAQATQHEHELPKEASHLGARHAQDLDEPLADERAVAAHGARRLVGAAKLAESLARGGQHTRHSRVVRVCVASAHGAHARMPAPMRAEMTSQQPTYHARGPSIGAVVHVRVDERKACSA
jgi:hypothetical protein